MGLVMESSVKVEKFDEAIKNAILSGSNSILIGESHSRCPALLHLINFLLNNPDLCKAYNFDIFYESYPALEDKFPKQLNEEDINLYEDDKTLKNLIRDLPKNVRIYGLETLETDPFLPYKDPRFQENAESFAGLKSLLEKLDLLQVVESTTQELRGISFDQFHQKFRFSASCALAADIYGKNIRRLTKPNKIFSEFIEQVPESTICFALVGNAHMPCVKIDENVIDIGMENRLQKQDRTHNLVVTTVMHNKDNTGLPYQVKENEYTYELINNISLVDDPKPKNLQKLVNDNNAPSYQNNPARKFQPKFVHRSSTDNIVESSEEHSNLLEQPDADIRPRKCCPFCRCF